MRQKSSTIALFLLKDWGKGLSEKNCNQIKMWYNILNKNNIPLAFFAF